MLSRILILFTSLLASLVAAQNTTFDPSSVDLTTKNQWCSGEQTNCPLLCGGPASTKANSCTGSNLQYTCTCSNGTSPPNIADYLNTLPNYICQATFGQCRQQNPGSPTCKTCGTLQASDVPAASSSAASSSSAGPTSSGTASAAPAVTSSAKPGAAENMRPMASGAAVVGGVVAALLL